MNKIAFSSYDDFIARWKVSVPPDFNFAFDVVDRIAAEEPHRPAMVHVDDANRRLDLDIRYFSRESSRLAAGLAAHGLRKGDRVMLILYRRVAFWTAVLALHKLGAVAIPSPAMLTEKDIEYRLKMADVRGVIADESVLRLVDAARAASPECRVAVSIGTSAKQPGWVDFEQVCREGDAGAARLEKTSGGSDPLFIFFSSGTTGAPKMILHDHTYALAHLTTALYWQDLRPGDLHLTIADTGWAKAAWGKLYGQWMAGAAVFVYDFRGRFNATHMLQLMADHKVTTFCAPPTVYRLMLMHHDLHKFDLSALRHCTSAGELLNRDIFDGWKSATGISLYEGYGQTETTLQLATFPFMPLKPGSIGKPCPGWDVVLLDEDGREVAPHQEGEICIRLNGKHPLGLFNGYLADADMTARVMRNGLYRTGDKAHRDEDGYHWFLGRNDDLIKSSGYRIGPFEVESALLTHPAVAETAVTGVPDPVRGQIVKATVVLKPGFSPSEKMIHELQDHVKSITASYKYPRIVEFAAELPKTISGKIRRAEIRNRDRARHADNAPTP
ncbi:MAG: Acetyl-coenzyme A synthetase [Verrucomicrobia bacterium ADurb.Bin345]|nr:MAG: Acetyl-coenzyme A synthetase [Verrucomicrobia bacterium ADurb.Bin345]